MNTEEWMKKMLSSCENSIEYNLEKVIINFTENICKLMEEQHLTKKELAKRLNVSPSYITKLLSGVANPTLKTMVSLALTLGRTLDVKMPPKGFSEGFAINTTIQVNYEPQPSYKYEINEAA